MSIEQDSLNRSAASNNGVSLLRNRINDPDTSKIKHHSVGHDGDGTYSGFIAYIADGGGENQRRRLRIVIQSDSTSHGFPILVHRNLTVPNDPDFDFDEVDGIRVGYEIKDNQAVSIWSLDPGESLPFS